MHLEMTLFLEWKEMRIYLLTDSIFFDTDCISAFLWVNNESLLAKMYSGRIVIPQEVYKELSRPTVRHLKKRVDQLVKNKQAEVVAMDVTTEEYSLYRKLTTYSEDNTKVIGKGEAASISLAKKHDGILASNNLRDVAHYVKLYSLKHITTGDILVEALNLKIITEEQGNEIWKNMLAKRRKLGADSFTEYINKNK